MVTSSAPIISYNTPNVYTVGMAITPLSPTNTGGAATSYSIIPVLPSGLSFNTSTGVISGTPTVTSAATNYTIMATNASGCGQVVIGITTQSSPYITGAGTAFRGVEYDFILHNYAPGDTFTWNYPSVYISLIGNQNTASQLSTILKVTGVRSLSHLPFHVPSHMLTELLQLYRIQ